MQVRYVKHGVSAKIGDIREHTPAQARVLIKLGIAVRHRSSSSGTEEPKPSKQPAPSKSAARKRAPKKGEVFGNLPKVSADDAKTDPKEKASE